MNTDSEEILGYHFLAADRHTRRAYGYPPPVLVEAGQTLTESRPLVMCQVGLHASVRALDALQYAPGPVVCRVRLGGQILAAADKHCASQRTCLAMADAATVLHEFACWCAEIALQAERAAGREPDPRSWAAIEAKRAWLRGEIDDQALAAARAVAWAAAWVAAGNARDARAAARAAASAAARDAAWAAAGVAAWDAASAEYNAELERRIAVLLGMAA
jgi:hypothetical protein